jgi:predicted transcriptional regulator
MRRSRPQIISQILELCMGGANKTKIVYKTNLNFRNATRFIDWLTNKGLLEIKQGSIIEYETTEKGVEFLENLKEINSEVSEL